MAESERYVMEEKVNIQELLELLKNDASWEPDPEIREMVVQMFSYYYEW